MEEEEEEEGDYGTVFATYTVDEPKDLVDIFEETSATTWWNATNSLAMSILTSVIAAVILFLMFMSVQMRPNIAQPNRASRRNRSRRQSLRRKGKRLTTVHEVLPDELQKTTDDLTNNDDNTSGSDDPVAENLETIYPTKENERREDKGKNPEDVKNEKNDEVEDEDATEKADDSNDTEDEQEEEDKTYIVGDSDKDDNDDKYDKGDDNDGSVSGSGEGGWMVEEGQRDGEDKEEEEKQKRVNIEEPQEIDDVEANAEETVEEQKSKYILERKGAKTRKKEKYMTHYKRKTSVEYTAASEHKISKEINRHVGNRVRSESFQDRLTCPPDSLMTYICDTTPARENEHSSFQDPYNLPCFNENAKSNEDNWVSYWRTSERSSNFSDFFLPPDGPLLKDSSSLMTPNNQFCNLIDSSDGSGEAFPFLYQGASSELLESMQKTAPQIVGNKDDKLNSSMNQPYSYTGHTVDDIVNSLKKFPDILSELKSYLPPWMDEKQASDNSEISQLPAFGEKRKKMKKTDLESKVEAVGFGETSRWSAPARTMTRDVEAQAYLINGNECAEASQFSPSTSLENNEHINTFAQDYGRFCSISHNVNSMYGVNEFFSIGAEQKGECEEEE